MRMTKGIDIWECENCGEAVIMGRRCPVCGASYADQLAAERKERKSRQPKFRKPAEERKFTQSYLFKKDKKNEN